MTTPPVEDQSWQESLILESQQNLAICKKLLAIVIYLSSTFNDDDIKTVINYLIINNGTDEDIDNVKKWHYNSIVTSQKHASRIQSFIDELNHSLRDINFNAGNDEYYSEQQKPIRRYIREYAVYIDTLLPAFTHRQTKQIYQRSMRVLVKLLDENSEMMNEILDEKDVWDLRLQNSKDRESEKYK